MIVLILLAFVGMLTGIFLILGMTPFTFAEELTKPLSGRRQPISKRIQQVNHPKEPKGIRKTVLEAREMLILTGKGGKFAAICAFSLFLAAMGAVICIVIQNYFMLPVLAAGMGLLPFWYVLFTSHSYKKLMNNEIETGLSIITSSYLRSESMITAVEENIHYLNPPVADVFRGFLAETNMICAFGGFRHQCCDPDFGKCRCCLSMKHTRQDLKIMQGWSLERKIRVTQTRIMEWYMRYDGQVFISFSGGKDSTVLLDLARRVYHSLIPGAAEGFGLQWESISTDDPQAVVDTLASGKLIVALMSKGHFTSSGHFMVLRGVTSEGKILVADPASKKRSEQEWDISIILDEARKGAAAGGPLWAIY